MLEVTYEGYNNKKKTGIIMNLVPLMSEGWKKFWIDLSCYEEASEDLFYCS